MNSMIDALLTLANLSAQPLSRQPVNLSQLAGFVIDDLRRGAPERQVDVEIAPGMVADGDPTLLRLVLENLLGNAWKYTSKTAQARISFGARQEDGKTIYYVQDNGAGFDMRYAGKLFGTFQRLHRADEFPGHGIGLANVQRIIHRHGGKVWAQGEPGLGATFYFTLPYSGSK
jgi:light-regulated signal transduction histidine kinase (bacteriophytochrome)